MCYLLIFYMTIVITTSESKVIQSWNLKNDSDSLNINIGVGYGVEGKTPMALTRNNSNINDFPNYRQTYVPRPARKIKVEEKNARDLPAPSMEPIRTPMQFDNGNNREKYDQIPRASYTSVINQRPTVKDLQKIVNNLEQTSKYSKIVQVVKVPALYEIHLQTDVDKNKEETVNTKQESNEIHNNNNKYLYLQNSYHGHDAYYRAEPQYWQNELMQPFVNPSKQFVSHSQQFVSPSQHFPQIQHADQVYDNRHVLPDGNIFQQKHFPQPYESQRPLNIRPTAMPHLKYHNQLQAMYEVAAPTFGKYPGPRPFRMRHNGVKANFPRTIHKQNVITPKFNSYSTLSPFVPYGSESVHHFQNTPTPTTEYSPTITEFPNFQFGQRLQPTPVTTPYRTIRDEELNANYISNRRNIVDTVQLTTNKPFKPLGLFYRDRPNFARTISGPREYEMKIVENDDLKNWQSRIDRLPLNFKIHVDEKYMFDKK